jgi:predicted  nucleic acid-binding Zn-ribbon protein
MHPTMRALLDLHDINQQRQLLRKQRESRETSIKDAAEGAAKTALKADAASAAAHEADALMRQYEQDIANADARIETLREKQMSAKTNKEYLIVINGIEDSKNIKKIRNERLTDLRSKIEGLQQAAATAAQLREQALARVEEIRNSNQGGIDASDTSEAELDRIYAEKRQPVDGKFLEAYERLIAGGHPMPLLPIDPRTRATPYGNLISMNHIEQIRKGGLICDHTSSAILYVNED